MLIVALADRPVAFGMMSGDQDSLDRAFGRHVKSCRRARGLTQEQLAEHAGLSADTIRRLEHGVFSPSLATLRKLCAGLRLRLATLFAAFDVGDRNPPAEIRDWLELLDDSEHEALLRLVFTLRTI